ncbi:annexin A8-like protein 1 [Amphibalanus amphitrite]|uniref:annexin A8-like protein 1 n=1 Tax=Amphibalanus amphitrite TaxID=1232801 RepID=UPI001C929944|nr:annexin A8-like protein 1 [Amphibalanus amphitrite]XP_043208699.1 annexin A8-like protein 1 [Amphibalanus amphitrite]
MVYFPTVTPHEGFNPEEDAAAIKKAMKGMGCDEGPIVAILSKRCIKQRVQIAECYKREYGKDLAEDLKKELGGDLETIMMALTYSYFEYLARELQSAFKGMSTKEKVVLDIILTRNNAEMHLLQDTYSKKCHSTLDEAVRKGMKGDIEKLLVSILSGSRDETDRVDQQKAKQQAQDLYKAGEKKLGTNEEAFRNIFASESLPQLLAIEKEYEAISKKTLQEAIKSELSGSFQKALLILLAVAKDKVEYYADCLYDSMQGAGTDDKTLIRIVVSRSELDLGAIKAKYLEKYGKTLDHSIERETSGAYKNALLALVRG